MEHQQILELTDTINKRIISEYNELKKDSNLYPDVHSMSRIHNRTLKILSLYDKLEVLKSVLV